MLVLAVYGITVPSNNSNKHRRVSVPEADEHPQRFSPAEAMSLEDHCRASNAEEATRTQAASSVGLKQPACRLVVLREEDPRRIDYDKDFGEADQERRVHRLEAKDRFNLLLEGTEVVAGAMRTALRQAACMIRQLVMVVVVAAVAVVLV
jgi:hypothetical protein